MATPTKVQAFGNVSASGTTVNASGSAVGSGNMLLVNAHAPTGTTTISDTLTLTWTALTASGGATGDVAWFAIVGAGGAETITITGVTGSISVSVLEVTGQKVGTPIDVQVASHGLTSAPSTGATASPASASELAVGLLSAGIVGTASVSARTFSPSLTSQSDETINGSSGTGFGWTAISDGPLASASAETFSATLGGSAFTWSAWCVLIQGAAGADLYVPERKPTAYLSI